MVGFWGHAISKLDPEYPFLIDGKTTYAWCALDTLFIPPLIDKAVRVEASDPITGAPVSLVVDAEGAHDVKPADAVVSMVVPDGPSATTSSKASAIASSSSPPPHPAPGGSPSMRARCCFLWRRRLSWAVA